MAAQIITVFSNKGGVGKTFISVNLSVSLALAGHKVLLVDLDFQMAQDMARMMNLAPKFSIVDLFSEMGDPSDEQKMLPKFVTAHTSGLDFVPAILNIKQAGHIGPENMKMFIRLASAEYDYIILDAGKALSETLITVFDNSNLILLIVTPDILSVYQTRWTLDVMQSLHFPMKMVKVVLNRSESRGGVAWQEVRAALPVEIFAHIPSEGRTVGMALNRGIPCVMDSPKSKVSEAFKRLAGQIKKPGVVVERKEIARERTSEGFKSPDTFWEKINLAEQSPAPKDVYEITQEEDEVIKLKKNIHEKLIQKLDLHQLTRDALNDPRQSESLRESTAKIISGLLAEEAGGIISSHAERQRLVKEITDETLGFGPLEDFLADPDVTDIMVNNKDEIYVEKHGKMIFTNKRFISDDQVRSVIERIIAPLGRRIDESVPMVDARLPDGSRINAIIPPLSLQGSMLTIRKFGRERITVNDLLYKHNSLTEGMAEFIHACVLGRKNVIISGGTGAGKTTLLNVVSQFIPDGERIITIEDAAELRLKKSHWARLESRPPNVEGKGAVTIRDLFVNTLRMRPDRIIIGECRGAEVLDMLQAMNTGHDGSLTTIHANSTRDVIIRMNSMMLLAGVELPLRAMNEMIATAIDIIVHVARYSDGSRKVTGISEVLGLKAESLLDQRDIFKFSQKGIDPEGRIVGDYTATGYVPECYGDFVMQSIPVKKEIFTPK